MDWGLKMICPRRKKGLIAVLAGSLILPAAAQELTDPTRPAEFRPASVAEDLPAELSNWKVTGIRVTPDDRSAIVNGAIVRAGDETGQATIREIHADRVIIEYRDKLVSVRLFDSLAIRKPAGGASGGVQ